MKSCKLWVCLCFSNIAYLKREMSISLIVNVFEIDALKINPQYTCVIYHVVPLFSFAGKISNLVATVAICRSKYANRDLAEGFIPLKYLHWPRDYIH